MYKVQLLSESPGKGLGMRKISATWMRVGPCVEEDEEVNEMRWTEENSRDETERWLWVVISCEVVDGFVTVRRRRKEIIIMILILFFLPFFLIPVIKMTHLIITPIFLRVYSVIEKEMILRSDSAAHANVPHYVCAVSPQFASSGVVFIIEMFRGMCSTGLTVNVVCSSVLWVCILIVLEYTVLSKLSCRTLSQAKCRRLSMQREEAL